MLERVHVVSSIRVGMLVSIVAVGRERSTTTYRETVLTSEAAVLGDLLGFFDDVNTFQAMNKVLAYDTVSIKRL